MIIDRNISNYVVFCDESIKIALAKMDHNQKQIVFAVTQSGVLEGVLTDGDFRRWVLKNNEVNLNDSVSKVINRNYSFSRTTDSNSKISTMLNERLKFIPIIDEHNHLLFIARNSDFSVIIENYQINNTSPSFIIAEIGNNHNGEIELAKKLVDAAIEAGADCAKFQMRHMDSLYRNYSKNNTDSEDLGSQYTQDLLSKFQLTDNQLFEVFDYCKQFGIIPLCTPWDRVSLEKLEKYGMPAYKVASADFTNHDLLEAFAKTHKPLICSTGMSTEAEIETSVNFLQSRGASYILLQCNSTYPAPFKDINIKYMNRLKEIGECIVGYSGHERGFHVPLAAIALGAKVIEKHFTLDRTMEGNDHRVSLMPDEFKAMVQAIREVEMSLQGDKVRHLSQGEIINRETLGKSLVACSDLKKGTVISADMITVKSPGSGLAPYNKKELVGLVLRRDMKTDDFFYTTDLIQNEVSARRYNFRRPWGLPVRYHDFDLMHSKTNLKLVEFHLSYKDLEADYAQYFKSKANYDMDLVIHAPELFVNDHTLDLCSKDLAYRLNSIKQLQSVVDLTLKLKSRFKKATTPLIIVNMGGFTQDAHLSVAERAELYKILKDSLSKINSDGVELIAQTMPPFPWHFGGQRFHNLFMDPNEIVKFCQETGLNICLDVSHSKLACNFFGWSFEEFLQKVGPYSVHLHLVDAKGVDGEGLQIGDGEIDFYSLGRVLDQYAPKASFIPEIWQGHKNDGEGFWVALDKLEKWY